MRVWALASCGGLLALAGCSTESNTPNPNAAPPEGDDAAQVSARPRVTAPSPTARPSTRSGQGLTDRVRLSPSVPTQSVAAGSPSSQASQLRERVQRLRAQHGSRLAPSTPITTVPVAQGSDTPIPIYSNLQAPNPQAPNLPTPNPPADLPQSSPGGFSNSDAAAVQFTASPGAAPARPDLPTPPGQFLGFGESSPALGGTAPGSGGAATANGARRHQGHSRTEGRGAVLSAPAPDFTVTRLHGGTLVARANQPEAAAVQAELPTAALAPAPASAPTSATEESLSDAIAAPAFTAGSSTDHQSSGSTALTLARQSSVNRAIHTGNGAHQSQGETLDLAPTASAAAIPSRATRLEPTRPAQAIAQPESLPLHSGAPRLSPPRSVDNTRSQPRVPSDPVPNGTAPEAAAIADGAAPAKPAMAIAPASTELAAPTLGHRGQADLEAIQLSPPDRPAPDLDTLDRYTGDNSKGLPANYCLPASGLTLTVEGLAQADTAPIPKFSPAGQPNVSPDQSGGANSAATLCLDSAADPELDIAPD